MARGNLFKKLPSRAPAIVMGCITRMRSVHERPISCRVTFPLVHDEVGTRAPKTVIFDSGIAYFGENPIIRT